MKALAHLGVAGLLLGLGLVSPHRAAGYSVQLYGKSSGALLRWDKKDLGYYVHPSCSADLPNQTCLAEVDGSFQAWVGPACSGISFGKLGTSSNLKLTAIGYGSNDKSEIAWIENSQWTAGKYTLGITGPYFWEDGTIFEADIALNGYLQTWSTSGEAYSTDVRNVLVHEIGHFFGLQHNLGGYDPDDPPTMAPTADPFMASRTPNADDLKGLCFLVPKSSFTCTATSQCPMVVDDGAQGEYYVGQLSCSNGSCGGVSNQIPEGTAPIGAVCSGKYDCKSTLFCQDLGDGTGVCASECQTASPKCPSGFECVPYANVAGAGVCLEAQGGQPGGGKANGQPCGSSAECASQLCVIENGGKVCRQPCLYDSQCAAGEECSPLQGANLGACAPAEAEPNGGAPLGNPCQSSAECESGLCAGSNFTYLCTSPCTKTSQCPPDHVCLGLSGGGGGCFAEDPAKGVGETCQAASECESSQCVSIGGGPYFCTDTCASTSDCPCGLECVTMVSGTSLCNFGAKIACVPEGGACQASSECASLGCLEGACATACSVFQGAAVCPEGLGCGRLAEGGPDGACVAAGTSGWGKPCSEDGDCQGLFCHQGSCEQVCNLNGPIAGCDPGMICEVAVGSLGRCVLPPPPPPPPPEPEPEPGPEPAATEAAGSDAAVTGGAPDTTTGTPGAEAAPTLAPGGVGYTASASRGGCGSAEPRAPWMVAAVLICAGLFHKRRYLPRRASP
jgi:hypothetical protein